jgi:hypothetical protein
MNSKIDKMQLFRFKVAAKNMDENQIHSRLINCKLSTINSCSISHQNECHRKTFIESERSTTFSKTKQNAKNDKSEIKIEKPTASQKRQAQKPV